jgi:acylphosphatase
MHLELNGWVRNLPDGRVEAFFEGPKTALEQILDWCRKGSGWASITGVESEWCNVKARYESFEIRE